MARTSNKTKAIAYAAEHGITLTAEDRDNFDGDYAVEVWSLNSHLSEPNSYCHTYFARGNTAEVWVCECCALLITNGDDSGCRDFHNHTHPTCDKSVTCADMESTFEVGYFYANCNGCGEIVRTGGTLYAAIRLTSN